MPPSRCMVPPVGQRRPDSPAWWRASSAGYPPSEQTDLPPARIGHGTASALIRPAHHPVWMALLGRRRAISTAPRRDPCPVGASQGTTSTPPLAGCGAVLGVGGPGGVLPGGVPPAGLPGIRVTASDEIEPGERAMAEQE